jgi:hypothetical protein
VLNEMEKWSRRATGGPEFGQGTFQVLKYPSKSTKISVSTVGTCIHIILIYS